MKLETLQSLPVRSTDELINLVGHPYEPLLAVSGIDSTVKIFSPDRRAQRDARNGINIACPRPQRSASGRIRGLRRRYTPSPPDSPRPPGEVKGQPTATAANRNESTSDDESSTDDEAPPRYHGLASRKRMQDNYQITNQNDADRRGGMQEASLTVFPSSTLALFKPRMKGMWYEPLLICGSL